jgi:hypothetical protein
MGSRDQPSGKGDGKGRRGDDGGRSKMNYAVANIFGPGCAFCKRTDHWFNDCTTAKLPENRESCERLKAIMEAVRKGRREVLNFKA